MFIQLIKLEPIWVYHTKCNFSQPQHKWKIISINKFIDYYVVFLFFRFRKSCKNCKCSRDGHEITAEHCARSRLGFIAKHDGLDARSLGYTFIPPGLSTARQVRIIVMIDLFSKKMNSIFLLYFRWNIITVHCPQLMCQNWAPKVKQYVHNVLLNNYQNKT